MEEIGGYFAKLSLVTDGSSFDKARQYLDGIGPAADHAAEAIAKLEAVYGGFGKQGSIYVPNGSGGSGVGSVPPSNQGGEDEAPKENERKKDAVTRASQLFTIKELIGVAKRIIGAIDKLASSAAQQTAATTVSAVRTGLSVEALNKWRASLEVWKIDFGAFVSGATSMETTFNKLKVGDASGLDAIAVPLSLLGLDPLVMMGMDNEQRIAAIFAAALKMGKTGEDGNKKARTLVEELFGDSGGAIYARAHDKGFSTVEDIFGVAGADYETPSPEEKDAADKLSQMQQALKALENSMGLSLLVGLKPSMDKLNELLGDSAFRQVLKDLSEAIGKLVGGVVIGVTLLGKGFTNVKNAIEDALSAGQPGYVPHTPPPPIKGAPAAGAESPYDYLNAQTNAMGQTGLTVNIYGATGMTPTELSGAVKDGITAAGELAGTAPPAGKPVSTPPPGTVTPGVSAHGRGQ